MFLCALCVKIRALYVAWLFALCLYVGGQAVVSFANLGGDAQLVVPGPLTDKSYYNHLANFIRNCPNNQIVKFWQKVGEIYQQEIGPQMKWLSTAGLGVYWLHVRIDSRPKYYRYKDYK